MRRAVIRTAVFVRDWAIVCGKVLGPVGRAIAWLFDKLRRGPVERVARRLRRVDPTKLIATVIMTIVFCLVLAFFNLHHVTTFGLGIAYGLLVPVMVARQ